MEIRERGRWCEWGEVWDTQSYGLTKVLLWVDVWKWETDLEGVVYLLMHRVCVN